MTDTPATLPRPKIPVWRTAYDGYRLGIGAIFSSGAMFRFFVYGSVLILSTFGVLLYASITMSGQVLGADASEVTMLTTFGSILLGLFGYALIAALQTPLGMSVHSQVLLGDRPKLPYFSYVVSSTGRRFFVASIAIYAIFYLAGMVHVPIVYLVYGMNPLDAKELSVLMAADPSSLAVIMSISFVAYMIAALLSARCAFAFAIAAIDRPGPTLRQSLAETHGTMWRLCFIFVLIFMIPVLVYLLASIVFTISVVVESVGQGQSGVGVFGSWEMVDMLLSPQLIVAAIVVLLAVMLSYVAMAAAAARAYQIRIERGMSGVAEVFS